jgi:hypothetical protein
MNWAPAAETRETDIYKMKQALKNGYTVIRILQNDIYTNSNYWEERLHQAIRMYERPFAVFITNSDKYDKHMEAFDEYIVY